MRYIVDLNKKAKLDILRHKKAGDIQALKKIEQLIEELEIHPTYGTGKPEQLKHFDGEVWSREITRKHRLVYEIFDDKVLVLVTQAWGHYHDK